jgi:hypothetical protein
VSNYVLQKGGVSWILPNEVLQQHSPNTQVYILARKRELLSESLS